MSSRALALVTIAIAGVALTGCSLLGNIAGGNDGTTTDVFTIKVGNCLNFGDGTGEVTEVQVIDCASAHDSEAYQSVIMTDGDFPGATAVEDAAISDCTTSFVTFVGHDYESSVLDFSYYYPTEASWADGDREILCLVVDPNGKSTGSLAGAAK